MPSVFRSRFEEKALLHFLRRSTIPPGELRTRDCPANLDD